MSECDCSKDSWGCPKCVSSDEEECDCIEKCTCIWKYNCGESYKEEMNLVTIDNNEDEEQCSCINCMCGKMSCWVCGRGEVPLDYKLCKIHDICMADLDECYETTIEIVKENGFEKRMYNGPFDIREGVGGVCPKCAQHPNFVPLE